MEKTKVRIKFTIPAFGGLYIREGELGYVDGYIYDSTFNICRAIVVLNDGSFHEIPLHAIEHYIE